MLVLVFGVEGGGYGKRSSEFTFAVEKENYIFAKSFVGGAVQRKDLDDFIGKMGGGGVVGPWVVC